MMKILIPAAVFLMLLFPVFVKASYIDLGEEINARVLEIWSRIKHAFETLDNWLDRVVGINFAKIFNFIVKIVLWFLDLIIKIFKWAVDLVL